MRVKRVLHQAQQSIESAQTVQPPSIRVKQIMKLQVVQLGQNVVRVKKAQHQRCPQIVRAVLVLVASINQQIITKGRPARIGQSVPLVNTVRTLRRL